MHPLLIHFPIVLLLFSPLFVVIAAAMPPAKHRPYLTSALITLLVGTISLFLAASSGEDAAELADRSGGVNAVLAAHEAMASTTEIVFSVLSIFFIALYLLPRFSSRPQTRISSTVAPLVFLGAYAVGLVYLVNTAHAGGRLVHEFGVRAMIPQEPVHPSQPAASIPQERQEGD